MTVLSVLLDLTLSAHLNDGSGSHHKMISESQKKFNILTAQVVAQLSVGPFHAISKHFQSTNARGIFQHDIIIRLCDPCSFLYSCPCCCCHFQDFHVSSNFPGLSLIPNCNTKLTTKVLELKTELEPKLLIVVILDKLRNKLQDFCDVNRHLTAPLTCANLRLRCDTIDERGGSTQRHDDLDKCANDLRHDMALEMWIVHVHERSE